jgi:hypothetical protein
MTEQEFENIVFKYNAGWEIKGRIERMNQIKEEFEKPEIFANSMANIIGLNTYNNIPDEEKIALQKAFILTAERSIEKYKEELNAL